jgi:hypothetical protein
MQPMVRESSPPEVPPDILQLSATFPFPWQMDLKIRARIRDALPPRPEAQFICEEAHRNALWQCVHFHSMPLLHSSSVDSI